jgi:protein-L-isoaspartate(D-aspartate) O-methyltransferase
MNPERARFNMIEQQIRPWEVLDPGVLDLLYSVRREEFVPQSHRSLAFADTEIPLVEGAAPDQVMLAPRLEARMLQELAIESGEKVLEIGTGSGYFTALLAARAGRVVSIEIDPRIAALGAANLSRAGVTNVMLETGNGLRGVLHQAPYDVIVLTGSVPDLPAALLEQMMPGGRLLAIVGTAPVMRARLHVRRSGGAIEATDLFDTVVAPLREAPAPARFRF